MAANRSTRSADRLIWAVARRQHGAVSRTQLLEAGITRHEIQSRLDRGSLIEIHKGVYLVGAVPTQHAYAQAALLALKGRGTLSHFSAASIWSLRSYPHLAHPWVTVPANARVSRPRIRIARCTLEDCDRRSRLGLCVTSPPRTVLDCATLYEDDYEYEALVAEAQFRGLANEDELQQQLARNPGKRGSPRLRRVLSLPGGPRRTRSGGERAFLRLLRNATIGGFETNSRAFGPELDFVWPAERFAVEIDGWAGHSGRVAFKRDRLKIARLAAKGVQVMPITSDQLRDDPVGVIQRLLETLAHRR